MHARRAQAGPVAGHGVARAGELHSVAVVHARRAQVSDRVGALLVTGVFLGGAIDHVILKLASQPVPVAGRR